MTMTKSTDLSRGKLEITAYLNKTTGQPEFFVPESQLVLNLPAATQFLKANSDRIILLNGIKRSCLDDFILRDEAFRDDNAFVINTSHTANGRLVCSVDGKRIAIRKAATAAIEAPHTQGLITVLRNEHNKTCVLSENFMMLGDYHVEVAIRQFGEGAPVKGSCVLNGETCEVYSPEDVLVEKNLNAESNSEHEIELEKKFTAEEAREEKRSKACEITAKLNIKLQTLPLENLTLTAPDGTLHTVPRKDVCFVTFFTPEPEIELVNDAGITFAKFTSAADAQAALNKFNENNSETETNSEADFACLEAFLKMPTVEALHSGYEAHCRKIDELMRRSDIAMKFRDYKFRIIQNEKDMAFYSKFQCEFAKKRCVELNDDTFRANFEIDMLKAENPDLVECGFFDEHEAKIEKSRKERAAETEKTLKEIPKSDEAQADDPTSTLETIPEKEVDVFDLLPSLEELNDPETEVEKILSKLEELQGEMEGMRPSEDYAKWREMQRREEDLLSRLIWLQPLSEGEPEVVEPENKLMKLVKLRLKVDEARWKVVRAKMEFEAAMEECLALEREAYYDAG